MSQVDDGFYVGYQPAASSTVRLRMHRVIATFAAVCLAVAIALSAAQAPFSSAIFEFGEFRVYEGELVEWPYPMLLAGGIRYLLVGEGKFGVAAIVRGHDGERVRLRGSLIERGPDRMLEMATGSFEPLPGRVDSPRETSDLGPVKVTGEIVDTKCHLGVMKPGEGKVHRGCAVRCISGGAPPGFLVRDAMGETRLLLLAGADGRPLGREVLDFIAEPVTIQGRLLRQGTALILRAEPRSFSRE